MAETAANAHYEKEMAHLMAEANSRIQQDLVAQKAQAKADAELDLSSFKHSLKVETDRHKDNATKAANAAVRKSSRNHPHAPPVSTSSSHRSRTNSIAGDRPS
jgi:hypothetical protein